jgi:hypothetical protein
MPKTKLADRRWSSKKFKRPMSSENVQISLRAQSFINVYFLKADAIKGLSLKTTDFNKDDEFYQQTYGMAINRFFPVIINMRIFLTLEVTLETCIL